MAYDGDLPCIHMKVYDHALQLGAESPKRPWICKLCGERGADPAEEWETSESYNEVVRRWHGHD